MSGTAPLLPGKAGPDTLALFGGTPAFDTPVGTSGLARPDIDRFLAYSRQFFDAGQYSNNGPLVRQLEARLAAFHGAAHCVTFCSGFWAMVLAIDVLKRPGKTEVVMPSLTYRRLADLAAWTGLKPRFCEVDPDTLAITAETARAAITADTALIIGVHPIVNCCDVAGLNALSEETGIPLLIDAVESVYEETPQGRVGSMARVEAFSMHASKLLNAGEGGYITTSDAGIAEKLRLLRGFGFRGADNVALPHGTNAKLNEVHAAMALANLDALDGFVEHNRRIYRLYQERLETVPGLRLVRFDESHRTSYKNIVVELTGAWPLPRDLTVKLLNAERVLARAYYAPALHQKPMRYPHVPATLPVTEALAERFVLMPSGFMAREDEIARVIALMGTLHADAAMILARLGEDAP